ncbi:DNA gyrase, A subunit [Aciduliprofundum sp. MAR08-339]|uniref:DNA gyrase subunit A n=1 Tax=Aciduliprofundum sp. (strain MAR08-339) TaxID=673860 RepID=UPI0002A4AF1C|nr:DNA gyrase, A subunit [Aciduliprofundum sp. MAR08-339]
MRIFEVSIDEEMKNSYMDYAMSVIVSRAIPDVRDGLKPVHRRILYGMYELGLMHNKPYKKSARIVGEVMGKYHPHGDQAIYNTLARMAQDFSMRYVLVDGQGNFGSIDGDAPAAMRYTEARLSRIAEEMLRDIDMDTVDFMPNFDGSLKEPVVLPARIPNLLINGSSGIAVGMATNMPPHNLGEVVDALVYLIDNPDADVGELLNYVSGPDFPTGGQIIGYGGLVDAYTKGKGKIRIRAKYEIEGDKIIVREIPYEVNKSNLLKKIASLVREDKIRGISDLKDESDRDGIRIVIKVKRDTNPEIVVNQLLEHTDLEVTYGIINLVLVNGVPRVLNLKELLQEYLKHRMDVLVRKLNYQLKRARERKHIIEGLVRALEMIDEVIATIKASRNVKEAMENLISMGFSDLQAKAILEMRLQKLTSMEIAALREENRKLEEDIARMEDLLAHEEKRYGVIRDELLEIKKNYGDERKTEILREAIERRDIEDLIPNKPAIIILTEKGYIRRMSPEEYRPQGRGGKGLIINYGEGDLPRDIVKANLHDYLLFFTRNGRVYWLKAYNVPEGSRRSRGRAIINVLPKLGSEVVRMLSVSDFHGYLFFVTKNGVVKRTPLEYFSHPRSLGIRAITFDEDDELVDVLITSGSEDVFLFTKFGMAIRFREDDVRSMGRTARGVRGIMLREGDEVISAGTTLNGHFVLTILSSGYGKRTNVNEYRLIKRGGYGVKNINTRGAFVVKSMLVGDTEEILLLTREGKSIRIPVSQMSVLGRTARGVRLIKLENGDEVVNAAKIS